MAVFLVDYENVCSCMGLYGIRYLTNKDKLYIYYSDVCKTVRKEEMNQIMQSECEFKITKLIQQHKNGLDFYIASDAGALAQLGENQIAIISKDGGFDAVIDHMREKYKNDDFYIVKAPNIEKAIITLNEKSDQERRSLIHSMVKAVNFEEEFARYEERNKLKTMIKDALSGTKHEEKLQEVLEYISGFDASSNGNLYTSALHTFGRSDGAEIYRRIKDVVRYSA